MFKIGLLTSTAMTAVALLFSGAPTGAYAQTDMHVARRDINRRFLDCYGSGPHQLRVSAYESASQSGVFVGAENVAVPVSGHGQTVHRIRVVEHQSAHTYYSSFSAGIYSANGPSGFPGTPIARGSGTIGPVSGAVEIKIPPTTLNRHQRYWIMETPIRASRNEPTKLYWNANPVTKRKAWVQCHESYFGSGPVPYSSSYSSPWTEQVTGVKFKLK